jgi:integrase
MEKWCRAINVRIDDNVALQTKNAAGITNKATHGLRKAAATRAVDNGATAHEVMAIFGWKDIKEAEYTRAASPQTLSRGRWGC